MATQASAKENATRVIVKLSAMGNISPDFDHPDRSIELSHSQNIVKIGRTSRDARKGFNAAKDNGWFNSPVMSRAHAELSADLDAQSVQIKDVGSLHGTFLNGSHEPLAQNHLHPLNHGDEISFGVPIIRSSETYPPTTLKVGLEYPRSHSEYHSQTFRAPEILDDDIYTDDDDHQDVQVVTALTKTVDLTELDEPVVVRSPAYVDLTSPVRSPILSPRYNGDLVLSSDNRIQQNTSQPGSLLRPTTALSSSSQAPTFGQAVSGISPPLSERLNTPYEDEESIRLTTDNEEELSDDDSEQVISSDESMDSEDRDDLVSNNSELLQHLEDASELEESDEEQDFLISYESEQHEEDEEDELDALDEFEQGQILFSMQKTLGNAGEDETRTCSFQQVVPPTNAAVLSHPKPNACDLSSILNPSDRQSSPSPAPYTSPAEELGAKSGKTEFFSAREANKANIVHTSAVHSQPPAMTTSSTFAPAVTPPNAKPTEAGQEVSSNPAPVDEEEAASNETSATVPKPTPPVTFELAKSPLLDSGAKFLTTPFNEDGRSYHQSDVVAGEEDAMLSAAVFQQHKLSSAVSNVNEEAAGSLKRKAEQISKSDNEVEPPIAPSDRSKKRKAVAPAPKKRAKSTARAVARDLGFAALGGGLVAGVLTTLIWTAPAFT